MEMGLRINADGDVAQLYIYGDIGADFGGPTGQDLVMMLSSIPEFQPLDVHINSRGGDAGDGIAMYNTLVRRPDVTTIVDGFAFSAASVVFAAGEHREMSQGSQSMMHLPRGQMGSVTAETIDAKAQSAKQALDNTGRSMAEIYASRSNGKLDAKTALDMMRAETYLSPQQALDIGLATRVSGHTAVAACGGKWLQAMGIEHTPPAIIRPTTFPRRNLVEATVRLERLRRT